MVQEEKLEEAKRLYKTANADQKYVLESLFPELKESEDERIRKALLEMVHDTTGDSLWVDYNVHKEDAIAWLEKQGKTFTKKDVDDAYLKGLCLCDAKQELEKQGEHELSEDLGEYITELSKQFPEVSFAKLSRIAVRVKNWLEKQGEQKPAAWSEEDENGLGDDLWAIKRARTIAKDENDMGNLWYAERWLKSLKERYTWKPSDEQMNALDDVISSRDIKYDVLSKLWQDLKKLRKE